MIKLTSLQEQHINSVRWLLKDNTPYTTIGRTWLLAYCFIEKAKARPGTNIAIWDHQPNRPDDVLKSIEDILHCNLEDFKDWNLFIKMIPLSIRMEKKDESST